MPRVTTIQLTEAQARMLWEFCCAGMGEIASNEEVASDHLKTAHEVEELCRRALRKFERLREAFPERS